MRKPWRDQEISGECQALRLRQVALEDTYLSCTITEPWTEYEYDCHSGSRLSLETKGGSREGGGQRGHAPKERLRDYHLESSFGLSLEDWVKQFVARELLSSGLV